MKVALALQLMRTALTEINRPSGEVGLPHINACRDITNLPTHRFGVWSTQIRMLRKLGRWLCIASIWGILVLHLLGKGPCCEY